MFSRSFRSVQNTNVLLRQWVYSHRHSFHTSSVWLRSNTPDTSFRTREAYAKRRDASPYGVTDIPDNNEDYRRSWSQLPHVRKRFQTVGLTKDQTARLLKGFLSSGFISQEEQGLSLNRNRDFASMDRALTQSLFQWVQSSASHKQVPQDIRELLIRLFSVADSAHPEDWYPRARTMRRKIIMHVGPTNSGKTHNALRALASARSGVYAGPLRLLAHEIFHRFNSGMIVPKEGSLGDPPGMHKRACNMITGEEQRIVDNDAGLTSCTVEMLNFVTHYDVAVVDEIQMISDPERGGAWTSAVLGLCAKEIHLCGEDSVVPLIQSILAETGDEIIVNRYDRLTPLTIADESLNGKLTGIQKGDCVVTFTRSGIFKLKKDIEEATGMRCAIAYGRLPPEVRSEQAILFNDPKSGYDVLVGSDALGMGLNLKIRRVIFEQVHKYDGRNRTTLSISQVKQIAGRAGRYGLHEDDSSGGIATTLHKHDLPILRRLMGAKIPESTKRAILPTRVEKHASVEELLTEPSFGAVFDILSTVSSISENYTTRDHVSGELASRTIDEVCKDMTVAERMLVFYAPIPWRDEAVVDAALVMLRKLGETSFVEFEEAIRGSDSASIAFEALDKLTSANTVDIHNANSNANINTDTNTNINSTPRINADLLRGLEAVYRITVLYLWFSFRLPVAFAEREVAARVKGRTEEAIEWCLTRLKGPRGSGKRNVESRRGVEREGMRGRGDRRVRGMYVDRDGDGETGYAPGRGRVMRRDEITKPDSKSNETKDEIELFREFLRSR